MARGSKAFIRTVANRAEYEAIEGITHSELKKQIWGVTFGINSQEAMIIGSHFDEILMEKVPHTSKEFHPEAVNLFKSFIKHNYKWFKLIETYSIPRVVFSRYKCKCLLDGYIPNKEYVLELKTHGLPDPVSFKKYCYDNKWIHQLAYYMWQSEYSERGILFGVSKHPKVYGQCFAIELERNSNEFRKLHAENMVAVEAYIKKYLS